MKIAVINFCGTVGKTVLSHYLFSPRMPESRFIAVETINQSAAVLGAKDVHEFSGGDFRQILRKMIAPDNVIADVGASNVEDFLFEMSRHAGGATQFDKYVVPVVAEQKVWEESMKTVDALAAFGIPADKIVMLPNRIKMNPLEEIPAIYNFIKATKRAQIIKDAWIPESELLGFMRKTGLSFYDLLDKDFKGEAQVAYRSGDEDEADRLSDLYSWSTLAVPLWSRLDDVYAALMD